MEIIPSFTEERVELIKRLGSPYYYGLNESQLCKMAASARLIHARQGEFIYHRGEPASFDYCLVNGLVKLIRHRPDGRVVIVKFIKPGLAFRMAHPGLDTPYVVSAQAATDVQALRWHMNDATGLVQEIPRLILNSLGVLTEIIIELVEALDEFACGSAEERLLWIIRRLASDLRENDHTTLPITQQELAASTGLSLYTVNRILRAWERRGMLQKHRHVLIVQLSKLEQEHISSLLQSKDD